MQISPFHPLMILFFCLNHLYAFSSLRSTIFDIVCYVFRLTEANRFQHHLALVLICGRLFTIYLVTLI